LDVTIRCSTLRNLNTSQGTMERCKYEVKAHAYENTLRTYLQLSNLDKLVSHLPRHLPSRIHTPGRRTGPDCPSLPVTFGPVSHQPPVRIVPLDDTCSRPGMSTSRQQNETICCLHKRCWGGQARQLHNSKMGESAFFITDVGVHPPASEKEFTWLRSQQG
jgi:hypothetical protein